MQRFKKILKFFFRLIGYAFLVLLLCAVLIQIPAVQKYLTGSLENYLQDKFQTTVTIESIRLRLPESLVIKELYIEDEQQDTFLNVGELSINFKLNKLLSNSIQFDQITLKNGEARILMASDSTNFDFITEAFGRAGAEPDSSKLEKEQSTPWELTFDDSALDIENIDFQYKDKEAIDLFAHIGKLKGKVKQIDLKQMQYQLEQLHLKDTQIDLTLGALESNVETLTASTPASTKFFIDANAVKLDNVGFDLDLSSMLFSTKVNKLESAATTFDLDGSDVKLTMPSVQIYETDIRYDIIDAPESGGFDYKHLDLQNITADLADFDYNNLAIDANIRQLSGMANEGFELEELQSNFSFREDRILLENLVFKSPQSDLKSNRTFIQYPFLEQVTNPLKALSIDSDMVANFKNSLVLSYFYPPLDSVSFFRNGKDLPLKLNSAIKGNFNDLNVRAFDLDGFNIRIDADGVIKNLDQVDLLNWNIHLRKFETNGDEIVSLIPEHILPEFVILPDTISLVGVSNGSLHNFQTQFVAETNRTLSPVATQMKANAIVKNILNIDSAYLDLQVDTFYTSKADILSYLPSDALPEYVNLPEYFILSGTVKGPFSNLASNLSLLTYRNNESNQLKAIGNISGLFTSDKPTFDIELDAASISKQELMALLPDSLLPDYFELPFIKNLSGFFKGDFENFSTSFELASNTGQWVIDASLKQEAYQLNLNVDDFQAESVFTQGYLDSLTGMSFLPLSVDVQIGGQGFDFSDQSFSDLLVTIKSAADTTMKGLVIEGQLDQQVLTLSAFAKEKEISVFSDFELDYTADIPEWNLSMQLDQLDLEALQLSDVPFELDGRLDANVKGYTLDTLKGMVKLSDWGILYGDKVERIDSLLLTADFDAEINKLNIDSDFFSASMRGKVKFPGVAEALQQQLFNYWQPDYPDDLIGQTRDFFDFEFSLFRPEILTMGYIPGLEELSPLQLEGNYNNRSGEIGLFADVPFFTWQKSTVEKLSIQADGNEKTLDYDLKFLEASIEEAINLKNFKSFGSLVDNVLENTTQLFDDEKTKRFEIKSLSDFSDNQGIQFSLARDQILNYQQWSMTEKNELNWKNADLSINDWRLFTDEQAIEIRKVENDKIAFTFDQFDLDIFADFLNSPVEPTGKLEGQKMVSLDGILNGNISFSDPEQETAITSALKVDSLILFNALLGNLNLFAQTDKGKVVQAEAILRGNGNDLRLLGDFDLAKQFNALDFQLDIPALNLSSIEPLIFGYLENMEGRLKGALRINGSLDQPDLSGRVNFENTAFDVALAKARLRLGNESLIFDSNVIEFEDLKIYDANDNEGIMSSYILTDDYRSFYLQSDIKVSNFQVLNTTAQDNDLYYGKLLVDAIVNLSGNITEPTIDVTAVPTTDSDITYVYSAVSNQIESHEGVVEFIQPKVEEKRRIVNAQLEKVSKGFNMKVIVKTSINDKLQVTAITDPITGDNFVGKAKGDLVYVQYPDGKMELNGSLELVKGEYLFTYQKLIRRPFEVKPGGTISWTGDPFNPKLNIDVLYKVKTSTFPLLASAADDNESILKQTFFVKLNIGGTLTQTEIATAIDYPEGNGNSNNADVKAAIDRINQDVGQQNTQAFAMILFNGFLANNVGNAAFQIIDVSGNINNMITSQLNNVANRYIKFVELDFGLDTDNNDLTTDFRVSIRKRFLNDRLTISLDGKTTSEAGNDEGDSQSYLDNIIVEYALTQDGRFKVKVYNSREFDDVVGGTGMKLGGAFVFSKDFNGVRLFGKKKE